MANRTVAVELTLGTAGYQRGAVQAEQTNRRIAASAASAGAEQEQAFARAAAGVQSAMERAARTTQSTSRVMQESTARTSTALGRMAVAAEEVPAAFASAANSSTRSFGAIATSATSAASSVVAADTRMTEASVASAQGIRLSLENRLALSAALIAQEGALASATVASTSAQASGFARLARAGTEAEKAFTAIRTTGLVLLGVFAAASVAAARFEKSMSGVGAVADATAEQMGQLRDAALQAGRDTAYTASQAADAEGELARAGVSVADIVGGALKGALSLAAAGQLSLSESATIAAQSMNTFGLRGRDVGHIADVLAAGANKSASDVHGLGESLRMGGLLAHQTGLSLEDTVAVLSAFADHALIGSDAGTSLKTMLQRLVPQSGEAVDAMAKLGFSAYDAQGRFVGLTELSARMQKSFGQLTPEARNSAMGIIFGSDAVRAATILYEQGAAGIDKYRQAVDDQGAAARMAAVQMDNLSGDLQYLKGSLEVALIQGGTAANNVLRDMVKWVNDVVNAYSALPGWAQTSAVAIAGIAGALALVAGSFMLAVPRIAAFKASLDTLAETMPRFAGAASMTMRALGPLGLILGVATAALAVFGNAQADAKKETEGLTEAVKADGAAVGANTRAWLAHELETRGVLKAAQDLGISTADLTSAILNQGDALSRVNARLNDIRPDLVAQGQAAQDSAGAQDTMGESLVKVDDALKGLSANLTKSVDSAKREAEATNGAADSTKGLGTAAKMTAADLSDTRSEADKLKDALTALNGVNIDAAQASIRYQKSLQDLRDAVKENGHGLDITTEKGRAVKEAMLGAADAAMKHAEAVMKQTNSSEQAQIVLGQDIEALKATMKAAGFTTDQIQSLTAAYASLPTAKQTQVTDPGALQTIKDLEAVKAKADGLPPGKSITVKAPSGEAIQDLEAIGYKVTSLPDGKVRVTVPLDDAFDGVTKIQQLINSIARQTIRVSLHTTVDGDYQHGFANGGVARASRGFTVPGYAPRHDSVHTVLSPGEGVLVPEATRRLGGEQGIDALNAWGRYDAPLPPGLIPGRQFVIAGGGASSVDHSRTTTVNLYGARQDSQEQLADLVRNITFVG